MPGSRCVSALVELKLQHEAELADARREKCLAMDSKKQSEAALERATMALTSNLSTIAGLDARCEALAQQLEHKRVMHEQAVAAGTQAQAALVRIGRPVMMAWCMTGLTATFSWVWAPVG